MARRLHSSGERAGLSRHVCETAFFWNFVSTDSTRYRWMSRQCVQLLGKFAGNLKSRTAPTLSKSNDRLWLRRWQRVTNGGGLQRTVADRPRTRRTPRIDTIGHRRATAGHFETSLPPN
jgi:hypothetical protein